MPDVTWQDGPGDLDPAAYYGPLFNFVEETSAISDAPASAIALNALVQFAARYGGVAVIPQNGEYETLHLYGLVIGPYHYGRKSSSAAMVADVFDSVSAFSSSFVALGDAPAPPRGLDGTMSGEQMSRETFEGGNRLFLRLDDLAEFRAIAERSGNTSAPAVRRGFEGKARRPGTVARIAADAHVCILGDATPQQLTDLRTVRALGPETLGTFLPAFAQAREHFSGFEGLPPDRRDYLARVVLANVAALGLDGERFALEVAPDALCTWEALDSIPRDYRWADPAGQPYAVNLGKNARRVAGLLALMNGERVVTVEAVAAASAWADYACRTLDHVYSKPLTVEQLYRRERLALRILGRLRERGRLPYFEVARWAKRKGDVTTDEVHQATGFLIRQRLIAEAVEKKPKGAGRPMRVLDPLLIADDLPAVPRGRPPKRDTFRPIIQNL